MERASQRLETLASHLIPEDTHATCPKGFGKQQSKVCPVTGFDTEKVYPKLLLGEPIRVCVTGAAGNIAYSLIFMIASGQLFGPKQKVVLHLLDIPPMADALKGVEMEITDCAFPIVKEIVATTDVKSAFLGVDVVFLVGAFPRQKGMERKDLLAKNAAIFKQQGDAIDKYASRDVKVLVVGNPANTNALICMNFAPSIPSTNFTAMTRLDHNRAKAQISSKLNIPAEQIQNVVIWGNHSATQYPDPSFGTIKDFPSKGFTVNAKSLINDEKWVQNDFLTAVQQRGAEIIKARKLSSAASAAKAAVDHMRDWLLGTPSGEFVSMGIISDGSYGVPKDLIYSFPVTCSKGQWKIVQGLTLNDFSKKAMEKTANELLEEKSEAFSLFKN